MLRINGLSDKQYDYQPVIDVIGADLDRGPWICGGAALSLYTRTPVNDIDVYFTDRHSRNEVMAKLDELKGSVISYNSDNAVTFKIHQDGPAGIPTYHKVQLIKKENFATLKQVFDSFDFSVCKIATDGRGNFAALPGAISDIGSKVLRCDNFIADSFIQRWAKYTMYGYEMDPETFRACASNISTQQFEKIYEFDNAY
jgi:hypothetical protein